MASEKEIQNTNRQNELLDVQYSIYEQLKKQAQQRVVFEGEVAEELQLENDILRDNLNLADKQKDGELKRLARRKELNKAANQNLGIARSLQSVTASELGTQKLLDKIAKDRVKLTKNINFLQKAAQETYSEDEKLNKAIQDNILNQVEAAKKLQKELSNVEKITKAIQNDGFLSIFDTMKKIVNLIPGLRELLPGFNQAADAYREALIFQKELGGKEQRSLLDKNLEAYKKGTKMPGGLNKKFMGGLPKDLQDQLKDKDGELLTGTAALARMKSLGMSFASPVKAAFSALGKFLKNFILLQFVASVLKVDKATGDLAKSMNLTYQESLGVVNSFNTMANSSNSVYVTTTKIAETQGFINSLLGTSVMLTEDQLVTMTKLREAAGFTNEELAGIFKLSATTGKEMETITKEVLAQASVSSTRLGVVLNERDILKEISKVSAATTLSLGQSTEAITEAVTTAKALGMELSKVEAIAGSILQFESSIEDELSAELLIGKELNLERARFAALNNDVATLSEEIAANFGTAAEFGELNRIQQEALAKAVGMNREELAQTLYVQEQLAGVSGEEAERRERLLNARIAEVGLAQAQQEMGEEGFEGLEKQASVQEQINALTEKLSEVFAAAAPTVLVIADAILSILKPVSALVGFFANIGKSLGGITGLVMGLIPAMIQLKFVTRAFALQGFRGAIAAIFRSFSMIPLGLGIPLAIGAVAGLSSLFTRKPQMADDLMSPPTAGNGYGDRILVSKEGAFAFNNRDTIQASTQGTPSSGGTPNVTTKLYVDNQKFAEASTLGFSKL